MKQQQLLLSALILLYADVEILANINLDAKARLNFSRHRGHHENHMQKERQTIYLSQPLGLCRLGAAY